MNVTNGKVYDEVQNQEKMDFNMLVILLISMPIIYQKLFFSKFYELIWLFTCILLHLFSSTFGKYMSPYGQILLSKQWFLVPTCLLRLWQFRYEVVLKIFEQKDHSLTYCFITMLFVEQPWLHVWCIRCQALVVNYRVLGVGRFVSYFKNTSSQSHRLFCCSAM